MITDPEVAKRVSEVLMKAFVDFDELRAEVEEKCPPEEYKQFAKCIGRVEGAIVMDVMEPLYEKHPELAPKNWNE